MPRPVTAGDRYFPGLDGVRAIAVLAVLGYHIGLPWMEGGLLGVGVFFTLSGFLITTLLLNSWDRTGGLELTTFWLRRARRLLPALVLVLAAVLLASAIVSATSLQVRGWEALGALFYVANWQQIAGDISYFDRVGGPGPFDHLWSLAVEEQFYLLWPLILLAMLTITRGRRRVVAALTVALAAGSFWLLSALADPGFDNTRAYVGTDTRAGGLLVGAALAMLWRPTGVRRELSPTARWGLDALGVLALAVIAALFVTTTSYSLSLYSWGLLVLSLATVALVAVSVHPESRIAAALGVAPMRWIGERSYGVYLWHLPVVFFTPVALLPEQPLTVAALQVTLTFLLATISWNRVEDPIRTLGFKAAFAGWRRTPGALGAPVPRYSAVGGSVVAVALAVAVLATTGWIGSERIAAAGASSAVSSELPPIAGPVPSEDPTPWPVPTDAPPSVSATPEPSATPTPAARPAAAERAQTSCKQVVHVGDSTSLGFVLTSYQPDAAARVPGMYTPVGVRASTADVDGARSIVERYRDKPNAEEAIAERAATGYQGCWVVALGINEAANIAVGGNVGADERIDRVMRHLSGPTLWTTVKTIKPTGPYADKNMAVWNDALLRACERYPNLRVYDWRSEVRNDWYIYDQIHYSTAGYAERAGRIADALARAYPAAAEPADSCLVTSGR